MRETGTKVISQKELAQASPEFDNLAREPESAEWRRNTLPGVPGAHNFSTQLGANFIVYIGREVHGNHPDRNKEGSYTMIRRARDLGVVLDDLDGDYTQRLAEQILPVLEEE